MRKGDGVAGGQWLIGACTTEIRAHRLIFVFILGPLLGYVLPGFMFTLGLAFAVTTSVSFAGRELANGSIWETLPWITGFALPLPALVFGALRERRRLLLSDQSAQATGMRLPAVQGDQLRAVVEQIWQSLTHNGGTVPRLICQPNFRVAAHAYDNRDGQAIEVSAGLAARIVRDDPLAVSILRHEIAHLVHRDLPAIRQQSLVAGAVTFSVDGAMAICLAAALLIVGYTNLGTFPMNPTFPNILAVHLAILCATAIVVLPLLLGRYVVRRYSGFLVALAEMRADVSAGIWGDGLASFSSQLAADPTVKGSTLTDRGLAYLSTALSHFPADERIAMLLRPERLATPKLRYFAAAILFVCLMAFHQGSQGWDTMLLVAIVALLQGLTVVMVLNMAGSLMLSWRRAVVLAAALITTQALPLISIEGLAYLAEHLTAALVTPGGFGGVETSLLQDTITTFKEFARFAGMAIGGSGAVFALLIAAVSLQVLSGLSWVKNTKGKTARLVAVGGLTALASVIVSYKFFQMALYGPVRLLAFRLGDADGADGGWYAALPSSLRQMGSAAAFQLSEVLNGPPLLEHIAWLRVALPPFVGLLVTLILIGLPMSAQKLCRKAARRQASSSNV